MIIEGMELKALQLEQENPYTMVKVSHTSNGVTYEARGWALWDGQGEWTNREGYRIAALRAKRKIARRLRWERYRYNRASKASNACDWARLESERQRHECETIEILHSDGGTVQL